jgi:hypothetical protein
MRILPLDQALELKQATFMWKLKNKLLPPSLISNFRTNNRNQTALLHNRLVSSTKHITFAGPRLWNDIHPTIQELKTPKSFSKALQKHLLNPGHNNNDINIRNNNRNINIRNNYNNGIYQGWRQGIGASRWDT